MGVMEDLNPRQRRFAKLYAQSLDPKRSATKAGYKEPQHGYRLIAHEGVARAIQIEHKRQRQRIEIDQDYVLNRLVEVVERCLQRRPVMVWDGDVKDTVQKIDDEGRHVWEFDSGGANRALELLGKHLGLYDVKVKVEGYVGVLHLLAQLDPERAASLLELDDHELREALSDASRRPALGP